MKHTLPVLLRGGPSNGRQTDAEVDLETRTIDTVDQTGFIYRDSGLFFHGRRIFDWTPSCYGPTVPAEKSGRGAETPAPERTAEAASRLPAA
jgi:hypothetical protein